MAYDDSSHYGDIICDEYDEENNLMNPPSPTGYYIYKIWGGCFDKIQARISKFLKDYSILSADASGLDYFWGLSYGMPRPELPSGRLMTDDEYRAYLYLRNCQLITLQNILINVGKVFGVEGQPVTVNPEEIYLRATDHLKYTSITANGSTLQKTLDDDTPHYLIDYDHSDDTDVATFGGKLSETPSALDVIYIPQKGEEEHWDTEFLDYLKPYLSIKGNLVLREYGY